MKIFMYIPTLSSGGAERQCAIVAAGLKHKYGHSVTVLLNCEPDSNWNNVSILQSAGVSTINLTHSFFGAFCRLYALLRKNRDAVLLTYLARPNLIGALAARLVGIRGVFSGIRCGWLPFHKKVIEVLVNRFLADGTIFNSYKAFNAFTKKGFLTKKSLVISNAIEMWNELDARPEGEVVQIVTVGRFTLEKDYSTWLSVIRNVSQAGYKIKARIVGWGKLEHKVRCLIKELNIGDIVEIKPGDSDVKKILSESDIYLSTSTSEGVSNAIMEAMNSMLPIVTTEAGDAKRMVEDGVSGYVTAIGDIQALTKSVEKLVRDYSSRREFGYRARKILAERYSVDRVLAQYEELIMNVG